VLRLQKFVHTIAIVAAGLVACWAGSLAVSAVEMLAILQISPGLLMQGGPVNMTRRIVLRLAGCVGLMVGGYVSAWFASRAHRSEIKHAFFVGCVYGVLGIMSHDSQPVSWVLACIIFLISTASASLGGWFREAQVRRYQGGGALSRSK
jgi:hypothetical protein